MVKSLVKFDNSILIEYSKWEHSNRGNWSVLSYINTFYSINDVLAISKLLFPEFIIINNCIILSFLYDEKTYTQWAKEFKKASLIERQCNFYFLKDFLHININEYESDEIKVKVQNEFANVLVVAWTHCCKSLFPDRNITVELISDYDELGITLYTEDDK